jgi:hypothetical protein
MKFDINVTVHLHSDHAFQEILAEILAMSQQLDELEATLTRNTDATDSVVVLITTLRQEIIDAGTDPAKLKAVTDKLAANTQKLADAAVANT